eukprot:CAMPEP_0197451336 /NCGR_PEP_ID=MMETSP1175-20131217/28491_1 /TAXON_ID=1003142 /ORGANISM="Triceratium dubium, Strain CCMP147" /LENGTH=124 /DNA_ID=CAMNT_0042984019 /DNA_START=46 /DNA_END=420 /DNA_ORIENTATION=+
MTFTRFVEIGRVALINYGPEQGKLCTIVDVVDGNRALVDGPVSLTGTSRQMINFRRLALTDFKVKIGRNARHKALAKAWEKANILEKWNESAWAKRIARRKARVASTDFERFSAMVEKKAARKK